MNDNENAVKLEVNMDSLKPAFENIATGFSDQGRAIRKLQFFQGILAVGLIGTNILIFVVR